MKFSERKGFKDKAEIIQKDAINDELRNSLWNVLDLLIWQKERFMWTQYGNEEMDEFSTALWFQYFKKPIDSRPNNSYRILDKIRDYFFSCFWYEVYDFLEWTLNRMKDKKLVNAVNNILERELSGYRFVSGVFTDITGDEELKVLEDELSDNTFPGVRSHLQAALNLLSNRESPDYRNSIKESISAVESIAKIITDNPKATLGQALSELEKDSKIHPALKQGFSKIYGYTSDEGGIRHAMLEEPSLSADDAKFFLLSCTSFINYLKTKIEA